MLPGATQGPLGPPIEQLIRHLFIDGGKEYSRTQMLRVMGSHEDIHQGMETLHFYYGHHSVCVVHGKGEHIRQLFAYVASHDGVGFIAHYKQDYLYRYYDSLLGGTILYLRDQQKIRFMPNSYPATVNYFYSSPEYGKICHFSTLL
jgi:hypothetical protein